MRKVVFVCLGLSLIPHLAPHDYAWQTVYPCLIAQCALVASLAAKLTPYTNLRLKSLLTLFAAFSWLDVALYPVRYLMAPYIVYACEVCVAFIFMLYVQTKWYNQPSDELDMDHVFLVLAKPKSFFELMLSLFMSTPTASVSIVARDKWFHYRKKTKLVEVTDVAIFKSRSKDYLVIQSQPVDVFTFHKLQSLEGSKWSLLNNCITQLKPVATNLNWLFAKRGS